VTVRGAPPATAVPTSLELRLPAWLPGFLAAHPAAYATRDDRAALVLDLAREHVEQQTGGPFAAAVFARETGRLIAVGLNLVVPTHVPVAHAEMLAYALAGRAVGRFDLGAVEPAEMVASAEPCAMCLGATVWSGISRLVCCARDEDARAIGFDEGDKPADWVALLERRGVDVERDVQRELAVAVLQRYVELGGEIYNGGLEQEAGD
jgi:tRNA(Arg) A34 adenosine deaminase TadA